MSSVNFIEPVRFRQEYIQLSQVKLARVLKLDLKTVQRWEKTSRISAYNLERMIQLRHILKEHPTYRHGDLAALGRLLDKQFEIPNELPVSKEVKDKPTPEEKKDTKRMQEWVHDLISEGWLESEAWMYAKNRMARANNEPELYPEFRKRPQR